jgi:hypothetical protein
MSLQCPQLMAILIPRLRGAWQRMGNDQDLGMLGLGEVTWRAHLPRVIWKSPKF